MKLVAVISLQLAAEAVGQLTCGGIKQIYQANSCCAESANEPVVGAPGTPKEPPIPGLMPGITKPRISLAVDVDYPPYAMMTVPPNGDYEIGGFGADVAKGLEEVCDIEISVRQTLWSECWDGSNELNTYGQGPRAGIALEAGYFHGCMTYTHTTGVRNRWLEFSDGILQANKPAGILTRLNPDGTPVISPNSDLSGFTIVDVAGWAPTADGLALVTNPCTGQRYSGYSMVTPPTSGNDAAMEMLMNGEADGMWLYGDQAKQFQPKEGIVPAWNVSLWEGFGTKYGYVASGLYDHAYNGTTLSISKKGSGLASILNPCISKFLATKSYYDLCAKYGIEEGCYTNSFFSNANSTGPKPWTAKTTAQTTTCSDGYCGCGAGGAMSK